MEKIKLAVHNFFDAVLENTETGEKKTYRAYNQVQDAWFSYTRDSGAASNKIMGGLAVGDGTGTMSLSRTALFHRLGGKTVTEVSSEVLSHSRFKRVVTVTFSETEVIGDLTEVGLCYGHSQLTAIVTHALFTDSEGNPITIPKTNTDRLTITATVFSEYTLSGPLYRYGVDKDKYKVSTALDYNDEIGKALSYNSRKTLPDILVGYGEGIRHGTSTNRGWPFWYHLTHFPCGNNSSATLGYAKGSNSATVSGNLVRTELSSQISSGDGNLSAAYQIRCISLENAFYLPFPNHDIYPPKQLTFNLAGDGSSRGFNLGVPELMTSNVTVTVDGVPLSNSDFTFWGRDISMWQGQLSADNRYLIDADLNENSSSINYIVTPFLQGGILAYNNSSDMMTFIYDFQSPITVDTVYTYRNCELYYSSDGETWTLAKAVTKSSGDAEAVSFPEVSARYWKFSYVPYRSGSSISDLTNNTRYRVGFYYNKPQIEFVNPPADGALIEVTAYTEYPIKNSNWIIDQTIFDITVERGGTT